MYKYIKRKKEREKERERYINIYDTSWTGPGWIGPAGSVMNGVIVLAIVWVLIERRATGWHGRGGGRGTTFQKIL